MTRPADLTPAAASRGQSAIFEALGPDALVAMLDELSDGMFVFDAGWHFRYVNRPAAVLLGRSREELIGAYAWALFPEAIDGPSYRAYARAREERRDIRVTEFYEPLGKLFEVRIHPMGDDLVVLFRDITAAQRAEDELREYAARMAEAETIARFGVWRWDVAAGEVRWSDELHRLYGLRPGEFAGTVEDFVARLHPDDRERVWAEVSRALQTLAPFAFEERIVWPDGGERLLLSQGRVIAGPDGEAAALVGVCRDITEHREAERALGMSERRLRAIVDNTPSVIAVKDLGGRYLMANVEAGRLVGMAPDELVGHLCTELFPRPVAEQLRINDATAAAEGRPVFDETILVRGGEPRTFATVTFPLPDDEGCPIETCTIGTDVTEKRERESERRVRREWRERIDAAVMDDRLLLFAQPIVDLATGAVASCELLIRMRSADDPSHVLLPEEFLPSAELFGLIQDIDVWVIRQALRLAPAQRLAVNLSAVTLGDERARHEIAGLLAASPDAANRIVFEITETAAAKHLDAACSFAAEVAALGCGLALDDFGTGFGSFTYLRRLPLRYLKIDRSFVSELVGSVGDRRVVQSIVGIARQFQLRTIAEGVENRETYDLLRELGADFAQGFHSGRPALFEPAAPSRRG